MKLYAQHGSKTGEKLSKGIESNFIDGVILSPRDISIDKLKGQLTSLKDDKKDVFFDPQMYIAPYDDGTLKIACLETDYSSCYYERINKMLLGVDPSILDGVISKALKFQGEMGFPTIISPNFLIADSFNSQDSLIALQVFNRAFSIAKQGGFNKNLFLTLIINKAILNDQQLLSNFLVQLIGLNLDVKGFYIIIGEIEPPSAKYSLSAKELHGALTLINKIKKEGYEIISGYSDLYSPIFSIAGASAVSSGWLTSRRSFYLKSFYPSKGGRTREPRYLSMRLLARITNTELEAIIKLTGKEFLNGLSGDNFFLKKGDERTTQEEETLQSWEALKHMLPTSNANVKQELAKYLQVLRDGSNLAEYVRNRTRIDTDLRFYDNLILGVSLFQSSLK
ncbi:hypothetical protein Dip518_000815 [Parelusimicrobium proximum]|uniref:hypothetical protein n=1 Tax=Parelusimicrobium proximum TaxID=3228953 RepID=UPI003D179896